MADNNAEFTGSIPENYDKYLGPLIFEGYSIDIANRIQASVADKVLEIAAGTGLATHHIRKAIPTETEFVVTDLNEPMLEMAKEKVSSLKNTTFQIVDGQNLEFADQSFDRIVCQFGIMFFPDKQRGVNEAFRVLKPEGQYLFSVWDSFEHNPLIKLVADTLIELFPKDPPSFLDVPLGYYKIDEIKRILELAGFGEIEISILPRTMQINEISNIPQGFIMGNPLSLQIPEMGGNLEQVMASVTERIVAKFGDVPIEVPMQAIVIKAHRPQ
jgi:ubiquinone/menaquinone biosynthesis C-methylase UbiE